MRLTLLLVLLLMPALTVFAENRFPQPQFESGYAIPDSPVPAARSAWLDALDVAVLAGALAASAWLVLRQRSRRGVFLLTIFSLIYFGFWRKGCVCAIGSIQNVTVWLCDSQAVLPLSIVAFFLMPLVFTLFFGRVFCAAVCPLGAIQEMMVLFPVRLPRRVLLVLGTIPVLYLGLSVLLAATGSAFLICRYDPFVSLFRLSGTVPILVAGLVLLGVGIFVARPYCRFLCPYGVLLNWASRLSRSHATITPDECVTCRLCETACPFDAIRKPASVVAEARDKGVRRLKGLLLLLPILCLVCGWAGARLDRVLAPIHPTVRLAEAVRTGDPAFEKEIEAYRGGGMNPEDLQSDAAAMVRQFHRGGWWLGGFIGGVFGLSLIALSTRRTRVGYEPDRGECLSCARCYLSCPREHVRLTSVQAP